MRMCEISTFRWQDATVTCERQLLAIAHVPSNLALISGQATGVVSPQSSAFTFTSGYTFFFHANEVLFPPETTDESR